MLLQRRMDALAAKDDCLCYAEETLQVSVVILPELYYVLE